MKEIKFAFIWCLSIIFVFFLTNCPFNKDDNDNNIKKEISINGTYVANWAEAMKIIKNGGDNKEYNIAISGDIAIFPSDYDNPTFGPLNNIEVILEGEGRLYLTDKGSIFWLGGGLYNPKQSLVINGQIILEGLSLDGNGNQNNNAPIIVVSDEGTLEMKNGIITGNTIFGAINSGGVSVSSNGIFTMTGGAITGNTSTTYSGGVWVSGTFIMSGGIINGNKASIGGGVYISGNYASFSKSGNSIIYGTNTTLEENRNVAIMTGETYGHYGSAVFFRKSDSNQYYCEYTLDEDQNISTYILPTNYGLNNAIGNWIKK